jgi:hypothetical protein
MPHSLWKIHYGFDYNKIPYTSRISNREFAEQMNHQHLSEYHLLINHHPTVLSEGKKIYHVECGRFWIYFHQLGLRYWFDYQQIVNAHNSAYIPIMMTNKGAIPCREFMVKYYPWQVKYLRDYHPQRPNFTLPQFVIQQQWPDDDEWEWNPTVNINLTGFKPILTKEIEYGGWRKSKSGRTLVPKRTGSRGVPEPEEVRTGWAIERPGYVSRIPYRGERDTGLYIPSDFSLSRQLQAGTAHSLCEGFAEGSSVDELQNQAV